VTGGDGTAGDPKVLCTAADVGAFLEDPVSDVGVFYRLGASIDFGGALLPRRSIFRGDFDGGGHTLANFRLNGGVLADVALIGEIGCDGHLHHLRLRDVEATGGATTTTTVGRVQGRVDHVVVQQARVVSHGRRAGGVVANVLAAATGVDACSAGVVSEVALIDSVVASIGTNASGAVDGTVGGIAISVGTGATLAFALVHSSLVSVKINKVGGLVAELRGTVSDSAVVDSTVEAGGDQAGGLVAVLNNGGAIENSTVINTKVTTGVGSRAAGIVAERFEGTGSATAATISGVVLSGLRVFARAAAAPGPGQAVIGFIGLNPTGPTTVTDVRWDNPALTTTIVAGPDAVLATAAELRTRQGPAFLADWTRPWGEPPTPAGLLRPFCGNGALDAGEACDPGSPAANDGCTASCDVVDGFQCGGRISICRQVSEANVAVGDVSLLDASVNTVPALTVLTSGTEAVCVVVAANQAVIGVDHPRLACADVPLTVSPTGSLAMSGVDVISSNGDPAIVSNVGGVLVADAAVTATVSAVVTTAGTVQLAGVLVTAPVVVAGGNTTVDIVNSLLIGNLTPSATVTVRQSTISATAEDTIVCARDGSCLTGQSSVQLGIDITSRRLVGGSGFVVDQGGAGELDEPFAWDLSFRPRGASGFFDAGAEQARPSLAPTGLGTDADPFQIRLGSDLEQLRAFEAGIFRLERDVVVPSTFTTITGGFSGELTGQQHALIGLRQTLLTSLGGELSSLRFEDADVSCSETGCGAIAAAVLAGGSLNDVHVVGTVRSTNPAGSAGGLVDNCRGSLTAVSFTGNVSGDAELGGIVRLVRAGCTVRNARMVGTMTTTGTDVGGGFGTVEGIVDQVLVIATRNAELLPPFRRVVAGGQTIKVLFRHDTDDLVGATRIPNEATLHDPESPFWDELGAFHAPPWVHRPGSAPGFLSQEP